MMYAHATRRIAIACALVLVSGLFAVAAPDSTSSDAALGSTMWWKLWRTADMATRQTMTSQLVKRGRDALAFIDAEQRAATNRRDTIALRDLERMRRRIWDAWHRARTPEGMVFVPAGWVEVPRTSAPWGPSGARRYVPAFYMDTHEVTVRAWRAWAHDVLDDVSEDVVGYGDLSRLRKSVRAMEDDPEDWPATRMTADLATRFASETCGGRLPRAEEFERALRGSGIARYPWGCGLSIHRANLRGYGPSEPRAIGSHPKGVTPRGIHDLVGNVSEWSETVRLWGRVGRVHLALGGSYRHRPGAGLTWRGRYRSLDPQSDRSAKPWIGFRRVKDVEQPRAAQSKGD